MSTDPHLLNDFLTFSFGGLFGLQGPLGPIQCGIAPGRKYPSGKITQATSGGSDLTLFGQSRKMEGCHISTGFKHWLCGEFAAWEFENKESVTFCPPVTTECHK